MVRHICHTGSGMGLRPFTFRYTAFDRGVVGVVRLICCFALCCLVMAAQAQLANSGWPKFRGGASNAGSSVGANVQPNLKWSTLIATGNNPSSACTDMNGNVYVGGGNNLYALGAAGGGVEWTFTAPASIQSSPAFDANGTVYIGSADPNNAANCNLYAINSATGAVEWKYNVGSPIYSSPAIDIDDTVYIAGNNGTLYALAGATGALNWQSTPGSSADSFKSSPALDQFAAANLGCIYITSYDGMAYCLSKTNGSVVWSVDTGTNVTSSPAIVVGGPGGGAWMYFGGQNGMVYAVENGQLEWTYATGAPINSSPAVGPLGAVYIGSENDNVYALNSYSGALVWSFSTTFAVDSSPAVGADGTVYVGPGDGYIYSLNGSSGAENWAYKTTNSTGSPSLGADGTLICQSGTSIIALSGVYVVQMTLLPTVVNGGQVSQLSVVLNQDAPVGGAYVGLNAENSAVLPDPEIAVIVQPYLMVPQGQKIYTVGVETNGVDFTVAVPIVATPALNMQAPLAVNQPSSAILTDVPTEIPETFFSTCVMTINCYAGPHGLLVYGSGPPKDVYFTPVFLPFHNNAVIEFNQTVSTQFFANALPVDNIVTVTIGASASNMYGVSLSATAPLTIDPAALQSVTITPAAVVGGTQATGTVNLDLPAGPSGTVVSLSSTSSSAQVPATVTIASQETSVNFQITTSSVTTHTSAEVTATLRGIGQSATLAINPVQLTSVSVNPSIVLGGTAAVGTVTLNGPAGGSGVNVALSCNTTQATVPSAVTVAAGQATGTFAVTTQQNYSLVTALITATQGGQTATAKLQIYPPTPISVALAPATVLGGVGSVGTVTLNAPAGPNGSVVTLSSGNSSAQVPATVTVSAGKVAATFQVTTTGVNTVTTAAISASILAISQSATLTLSPTALVQFTLTPSIVAGGSPSIGTVTLLGPAGPSGTPVVLSSLNPVATVPATVVVAFGQTTANFTITTAGVTSQEFAAITAKMNGQIQQTLTVNPASLMSITLNPNTVAGVSPSTGTAMLNGVAGPAGAVINLSSSSKDAQVPKSVAIGAGKSSGTFIVLTTAVTKPTTATITGSMLGSSAFATLTILPIGILSISLSPTEVMGGTPSAGMVTLTGLAPKGGTVVLLRSSNAAVTIPGSLRVAAGSSSATFTAKTNGVAKTTTVTVKGTVGSTSAVGTITVEPAVLISITLNPESVAADKRSTGTIAINGAAPPGGFKVSLSSSSKEATAPATVVIPVGKKTTTFTVTTAKAGANTSATIKASAGSVTLTATLTIT